MDFLLEIVLFDEFFFEYLPKNNNYSIETGNTQIINILCVYCIF